ncbi:MAG: tRNA-dihydrouridine synthase [Geodermatophilaceae bacterium]
MLVAEDRADYVDLNLRLPRPKVTRKGGGAALPFRRGLLRDILRAAVTAADAGIPVTIKMRARHRSVARRPTFDAGRIAQDEGSRRSRCTGAAAQMYGGAADWAAIAALKSDCGHSGARQRRHLGGLDAVRMVAETGCDGVVIGRGRLGPAVAVR